MFINRISTKREGKNIQNYSYKARRSSRKIEKETREKENNFFKISGVILASIIGLFIPAFYLFGLRFYEGVLSEYGININSLALDNIDIYVYSYYAIAHVASDYLHSFSTLMMLVVLLIMISIALIIIYRFLTSKKSFMKIVYLFKSDNHLSDEIADRVFTSYMFIIGLLSVLALLSILWITIPHAAYKKGQNLQSQNIRDYHLNGCHSQEDDWSNCTQILDENGTKVYEGLLIAIKGDRVALYQKNGSQVFTLKSDQRLYRAKLLDTNTTK